MGWAPAFPRALPGAKPRAGQGRRLRPTEARGRAWMSAGASWFPPHQCFRLLPPWLKWESRQLLLAHGERDRGRLRTHSADRGGSGNRDGVDLIDTGQARAARETDDCGGAAKRQEQTEVRRAGGTRVDPLAA